MPRRTRTGRRADSRRCWACAGRSGPATRTGSTARGDICQRLYLRQGVGPYALALGGSLLTGGGMEMSRAVLASLAVVGLALSPSTALSAWGPDSTLVIGGTGRYFVSWGMILPAPGGDLYATWRAAVGAGVSRVTPYG